MCGIVGSINHEVVKDCLSVLGHRGPDGSGLKSFNVSGNIVWFGHTRLSILDLSPAGHQPIRSKNGRWWLIYNGEIYNHLDLRERIDNEYRGHCDTETLVELIARKGIAAALSKLNGMFAFAAMDTRDEKLYLARDPYGIKPLYYVEKNKKFAFASEIKALRAMRLARDGVDHQGLQSFLSLRYTPSPETLWAGVKRLPAGHVFCIDIKTRNASLERFVGSSNEKFTGSISEATEAYRWKLKSSVERQLLSDVPVGLLLSGGIDSALVAAMAKELGAELPCYTVGFGRETRECEIDDANETAQILGLPFSSIEVTPDQMLEALPSIVRSVEEPLGTTSIMPMWHLVRRARQDVTVVLTGQGGDEPWGGYRRYQVEILRNLMPWPEFWQAAGRAVPSKVLPNILERGLRTLATTDFGERVLQACALFPQNERLAITGSGSDGYASTAIDSWINWLRDAKCDSTETMMRLDSRMNLADDLLLYGDKISMAVSLEARVPFLDIELMQFIESLPINYRVALGRTKIVHKRMAERYLPSSIVHRRKRGFEVPFREWSRGPWRTYCENMLLSGDAPHWELLKRDAVERLWGEHVSGRRDRSRQMFALLMLAIWWRQQGDL